MQIQRTASTLSRKADHIGGGWKVFVFLHQSRCEKSVSKDGFRDEIQRQTKLTILVSLTLRSDAVLSNSSLFPIFLTKLIFVEGSAVSPRCLLGLTGCGGGGQAARAGAVPGAGRRAGAAPPARERFHSLLSTWRLIRFPLILC